MGLGLGGSNDTPPPPTPNTHLNLPLTTEEVLTLTQGPSSSILSHSPYATTTLFGNIHTVGPRARYELDRDTRNFLRTNQQEGRAEEEGGFKVQAKWVYFYDVQPPSPSSTTSPSTSPPTKPPLTYSPLSRSLCILSSPTMLKVYHSTNGNHWDVPLPFESDGIEEGYSFGLFVKRKKGAEDEGKELDKIRKPNPSHPDTFELGLPPHLPPPPAYPNTSPESDGHPNLFSPPFFPPQPNRLSLSGSPPPMFEGAPHPSFHAHASEPYPEFQPQPLPSLFTLRHPLDELKPVAAYVLVDEEGGERENIGSSMDGGRSMDVDDNNSSSLSPPLMPSTPNPPTPTPMSFTPGSTKTNNRTQGNDTTNITHSPPPLLTDVLETLIYIHGESMSSKTKSLCPPFAVTWHGKRNRHAVWALQDVPEPELPEDLNVNFGEGLVGEGVEGIHNLASTLGHVPFVPNSGNDGSIVDHAIFAATLTRSQPLRSTGGQMPGSHSEALASALGVEEGGGLNNTVLSSSSNLSNAGAPQGDQQMVGMQFTHPGSTHSSNQGETQNDYVNAAGTIGRREGWGEEIHPNTSITCVWTEKNSSSPTPSTHTFLSTTPNPSSMYPHPLLSLLHSTTLTLLSLVLDPQTGAVCNVEPLGDIDCISAEPLTTEQSGDNIDILVLTPEHELALYRGTRRVEIFTLGIPGHIRVEAIKWGVEDRFHAFYKTSPESPTTVVRCQLSLSLASSSPLAETILYALSTTLPPELSTTLRADCVKVCQFISDPKMVPNFAPNWDHSLLSDPSLLGVSIVLQSILLRSFSTPLPPPSAQSHPKTALEKLLNSEYHLKYTSNNPLISTSILRLHPNYSPPNSINTASSTKSAIQSAVHENVPLKTPSMFNEHQGKHIATVFDTIHLLYEDSKLLLDRWEWLEPLSNLLSSFASYSSETSDFITHYENDFLLAHSPPTPPPPPPSRHPRHILTTFPSPPSIMSWLRKTMDNTPSTTPFPSTPPCDTSRIICRLYSILYHPDNTDLMLPDPDPSTTTAHRLVLALVDERMSSASLHNLPSGIALPILQAIHSTRSDPPEGWPAEAYHLIGREDLALTHAISEGLIKKPKPTSPEKRFQASQSKHEHECTYTAPTSSTEEEDKEDKDGLVLVTKYAAMLFNEDERVKEVSKLLRSSKPIFLKVDRPPEVSDHEFEQRKQQKLLLLCTRSMAAPIGRGMLTLGTCSPLLGTKLPIPDICLAGRVPPNNATVQLDTTNCSPTMKAWPDFHNGVAAGLRLTSAAGGRGINRTWIVYNRPAVGDAVNYSHGGLLMALGLRKHLGSLAMTDIYEYLTQGSDTTTVGVLLGMAATKRATCDPSVSKMLCLHIPSLLPPPFTDMDVSSVAQIAAVAGVGLLYQGSAHRLMTEFLLGEIGRKPNSDKNADREAYVLAAGFALGMVNLGKGKTGASAGLQDLRLEERLTQYLLGGKDTQPNKSFFRGGEDNSQKCSRIFEGDAVNVDVTSPGATMALGLLHIKSANKNVAARLSLPQTAADLDFCRPDFLLLRVVARALVLWDKDVEPTSEWVQRQIPDVVSRNWARLGEGGGFFKVAFGVANMTIKAHGVGGLGENSKGGIGAGVDENVDEQTIKQAYIHIVAGACFALGLRFAGTGNLDAKEVIMKELLMLKKLREDNDRQTMARKPARAMIDMSVGTAAIGLSMVMAGTGDTDTVKVIRQLRLKCEGVTYGTHACLGSALGLLFLGGGSCTLGRSNEDIAALLVAFYPRWPISSTDHQFHLQALRHLYALAVVERSVECVDVITGNPVFVPVAFKEGGEDRKAMSPLLLKEGVEELRLDTDRYYQVKFGGPGGVDALLRGGGGGIIYVKRKVGHLTYQQDPHGLRSLRLEEGRGGLEEFTEDADLLMFSKYLCGNGDGESEKFEKEMPGLGTFSEFCRKTLPLVVEKTEALQLYLNLRSMVELLGKTRNMQVIENVKIGAKTCEEGTGGGGEKKLREGLVEEDFLLLLEENVDIFFEGIIGVERVKELEGGGKAENFVERAYGVWKAE